MQYRLVLIVFVYYARADDVNSTPYRIKEIAKSKLLEDNPFYEIENANTTLNGFCAGFADIEVSFCYKIDNNLGLLMLDRMNSTKHWIA